MYGSAWAENELSPDLDPQRLGARGLGGVHDASPTLTSSSTAANRSRADRCNRGLEVGLEGKADPLC